MCGLGGGGGTHWRLPSTWPLLVRNTAFEHTTKDNKADRTLFVSATWPTRHWVVARRNKKAHCLIVPALIIDAATGREAKLSGSYHTCNMLAQDETVACATPLALDPWSVSFQALTTDWETAGVDAGGSDDE